MTDVGEMLGIDDSGRKIADCYYLPRQHELDAYALILDAADFDGNKPRWSNANRGHTRKQMIVTPKNREDDDEITKLGMALHHAKYLLNHPADINEGKGNSFWEPISILHSALDHAQGFLIKNQSQTTLSSSVRVNVFDRLGEDGRAVLDTTSHALNHARGEIKKSLDHIKRNIIKAERQKKKFIFENSDDRNAANQAIRYIDTLLNHIEKRRERSVA